MRSSIPPFILRPRRAPGGGRGYGHGRGHEPQDADVPRRQVPTSPASSIAHAGGVGLRRRGRGRRNSYERQWRAERGRRGRGGCGCACHRRPVAGGLRRPRRRPGDGARRASRRRGACPTSYVSMASKIHAAVRPHLIPAGRIHLARRDGEYVLNRFGNNAAATAGADADADAVGGKVADYAALPVAGAEVPVGEGAVPLPGTRICAARRRHRYL
ncbi:hypothetical protein B0H11DRAFT_13567 [Mycena galericulata]|nr:hypothetical protein B0H11DRAFT_13567 [Mycena galericulata]